MNDDVQYLWEQLLAQSARIDRTNRIAWSAVAICAVNTVVIALLILIR